MKKFMACIFMLLLAPVWAAEIPPAELLRLDDNGLAIDGYSPVSYIQRGKAERGSPVFTSVYEAATYQFTDQQQIDIFEQYPERYIPVHGGWCSLMLSGSGNLTPANPESWKIVDGQLLMFWSGTYNGMEINGLSNWEKKTGGKEKAEAKRLADANKTWSKITEGKKKPTIVLFSERDKGLFNGHQTRYVKE